MSSRLTISVLVCFILTRESVSVRRNQTGAHMMQFAVAEDGVAKNEQSVGMEHTNTDRQETVELVDDAHDGMILEEESLSRPPKKRTKDLKKCEAVLDGRWAHDPCIHITNDYCKDDGRPTGFERRRERYMAMSIFRGFPVDRTCKRATPAQVEKPGNIMCCISQPRAKPWPQIKLDVVDLEMPTADIYDAELAYEELTAAGEHEKAEEAKQDLDNALEKAQAAKEKAGGNEDDKAQLAMKACAEFAAQRKKKKGRKDNWHNCKEGQKGADLFRRHPNRYKGLPSGYECRRMKDPENGKTICGACAVRGFFGNLWSAVSSPAIATCNP